MQKLQKQKKPPCGVEPQGGLCAGRIASAVVLCLLVLLVVLLILLILLILLLALLLLLLVVLLILLVLSILEILVHDDTSVNKLHCMHEYYSAKKQRIYTYFLDLKRGILPCIFRPADIYLWKYHRREPQYEKASIKIS